MPVEVPKDQWNGTVKTITLGATADDGGTRATTATIGGAQTLPFMHFEAPTVHGPLVALEIRPGRPADWSPLLLDVWGDVVNDPAAWAAACEEAGADLIELMFDLNDPDGNPITPEFAVEATKAVLGATGLPVIVVGPGQAEVDNEIMVPIAEATKGERLLLGLCEDKNYRTIVAAALANDHLVMARSPMDVNLASNSTF